MPERDFITAVRYSTNDAYLAVADNAKNVKCYNTGNYADITRDLWQHHAGRITALAWSPDSAHLATSGVDTHCIIYSPSKTTDYIQIKSKPESRPRACLTTSLDPSFCFDHRCTSAESIDLVRLAGQQPRDNQQPGLLPEKVENQLLSARPLSQSRQSQAAVFLLLV